MPDLRRILEWYLGVPRAGAGQRTDWRLELQSFGGSQFSAALTLLGLLVVVYLAAIYWRDAVNASRKLRAGLIALRFAVVALAALCLLQAALSIGRMGLPVIAILVDDSASMGLEDRYSPDASNSMAEGLLKEAGISTPTRLGLAQAILTRRDGEFLRELLEHHSVRLYHFSDTALPLSSKDFASADDVPEMVREIRQLKAEGSRTRPGPAIRKVLQDFRGNPPAAVVVFSDGVSSTGDADRLSPAADAAASQVVPIYTVGLGTEQPMRDLQLYDVSAEDLAFVGDPYVVTGKIKADGFASGRPVTVRLSNRDSGQVMAETTVRLPTGSEAVPFELSYVPRAAGEIDVSIEVPPLPDESNRDNNRETRHVSIRGEKLRVLLVDSSPRWEFRYLKTLLERDPTVSLKTVLQEADAEFASEDQTALSHFPLNRDELFRYDVLILGDLNPALVGTPTLELVRDFVRDSGGGVLFIAGSNFNPTGFRGTPLEELMPLDLSSLQPLEDTNITSDGFRPELTIDGLRGTSIFRLADTEASTLELWKRLPELYWLVGSATPRPGARVFAVWRGATTGKDVPVVAMLPVGAGKVLFYGTDEFWRWRFRVGDQYLGPFWSRAVRYLSRSRLVGRDRTAELTSDRLTYSAGESPTLRVRFFDERFIPAGTSSVTLLLERRNGERRNVSLPRVAGQPTVFEGQAAALPIGAYHALVTSPSFRESPPATDFRIEAGSDELAKRDLDRREMEQAARISRGQYSGLAEASDLPSQIPPGHPVLLSARDRIPLWNRWELLVLFAGLLTTEWILRKRARLV
jgi:hypothetical protein